jgi:hypothetical protein
MPEVREPQRHGVTARSARGMVDAAPGQVMERTVRSTSGNNYLLANYAHAARDHADAVAESARQADVTVNL